MSDPKFPPKPPAKPPSDGGGRRWAPLEPPPPRPPDAVIIPEGQLAHLLPDGLAEALEDEGPSVLLDPRWRATRDAFLASVDKRWGEIILEELSRLIARQKDGVKESAKDLWQKVLLVVSGRFEQHVAQTGEAWAPDNPGAYLRGVSRNIAREHFRAKARRPAIERGVEVDETPDAVPDPEEATSHAELLAIFERERGTLTAEEAEVFEGRASLGMTWPAIAAVLERPISTVQTQLARAVAKLQAIVARASAEPSAGDAVDARDVGGRRRD
jgi:RNA polymerase sigma factor (sigma-70 family)